MRDKKIAFEAVELWAEDVAKENNIPFNKVTFEQLDLKLKSGKNIPKDKPLAAKTNARQQAIVFKNESWFNACLDEGINLVGIDRVLELMQKGLTIANEYKTNEAQMLKNKAEAKTLIAQSFLEIFDKTGVEMIHSCDDAEVRVIYSDLKAKSAL